MNYRVTYLNHSGIKGMKWGVRRYQNRDGTLTEEGKRRYRTVQNFERQRQIKKDRRKQIAKDVALATVKIIATTTLKTAVVAGTVALGANVLGPVIQQLADTVISTYKYGTGSYGSNKGDWAFAIANTISNYGK